MGFPASFRAVRVTTRSGVCRSQESDDGFRHGRDVGAHRFFDIGGPHPMRAQELCEVQRCVLVQGGRDAFGDGDVLRSRARAAAFQQAFDMGQAACAEQRRLGGIGAPQTGFRPVHTERDQGAVRQEPCPTAAARSGRAGPGHERPAPRFAAKKPHALQRHQRPAHGALADLEFIGQDELVRQTFADLPFACFDPADHFGFCGLVERRARHGPVSLFFYRNPLRPFARGVNSGVRSIANDGRRL
jgi:hypothetical protein